VQAAQGFPSRLTFCLYLAFAGAALWLSIYRPFHNWDVVGYVAAAKSFEQSDTAALQAFTYAELRAVLPAEVYEDIAREKNLGAGRGALYRRTVNTNPAAFAEQLPYYKIRPLYVSLIYLFYKAGVDIEFATHLISGIAVALALLVLYLTAIPRLNITLACLLPLLAWMFGVFDLARFSTPDGLAFFAVLLIAYLLSRRRIDWLCLALPVALCVRTDLMLFTAPLLLALFVTERKCRIQIALSGAASLVAYVGILTHYHHPGWATLFYFNVIERCIYPLSNPPTLTLQDYFTALANGTTALLADKAFLAYLALIALAACLLRKPTLTSVPAILLLASFVHIVCRFLVLPFMWERFFTAPYTISALALFWLIRDARSKADQPRASGVTLSDPENS
jgi:hypothetical protein